LAIHQAKVRLHLVELESMTPHHEAFSGVEDLYCCLGTTRKKAGSKERFREIDFELPLRLAQYALARGAQRMILVSSVGASAQAKSFYGKTKGELEQALSALGFPSLIICRPSLLVGERLEKRRLEAWGIALGQRMAPALRGPLRRYRPLEAAAVGQAMVRLALDPGRTGRHIIESEDLA
jgi:uncharacterized protein YbjT (DUF2867 family)